MAAVVPRRFLTAAVLAIGVALPLNAEVRSNPLAGLDTYVEKTMQRWDVPGAAVAVVKDQKVVFARGFGVRDLKTGGKVDADTLFAIGSNTKSFTATALGLLVSSGRISWDDPVLKYLPEFQMHDPRVTRELTIRDLLCHRSGLGTFNGDLMAFASVYDRAEVIRRIRFVEPAYEFRTGFGYSNLMFLVAGEIIPRVTGTSWDDFMRQRFFAPLGMTRSNTSFRELEAAANVATPHGLDDGKVVPIPHDRVDNIGPAGSINSSANDMARWLLLQTGGGAIDGTSVVDPAVIAETRKPHNLQPIGDSRKALNPWTHFSAYGLGWDVADYQGRLVVSHGGGLNGMISMVAMLPEENLGVVVLTNFDTHALTRSVVYRVFDAYLGVPPRDWDERYAKVIQAFLDARKLAHTTKDGAPTRNAGPSHPLDAYTGRYTSAVYGDAEVTLEAGALKLQPKAHPQISGRLEHLRYDTFLCRWTDRVWDLSSVFFDLDDAGKIARLRFVVRPDWLDTMEYVFVKQ